MRGVKGWAKLRDIVETYGTKGAAEAYGVSRRQVQSWLKEGPSDRARERIAAGPVTMSIGRTSAAYRSRQSLPRGIAPARLFDQPKTTAAPTMRAARAADNRPVREIVAEQRLVAGEQGAYIVGGVLAVTEATLRASGVEYREIRIARFPELNQAIANAHETVIRNNEGVPYAIVLGSDGRYYGVILGSNTDPGAIYDDEGYQALYEFAESGDAPAGWEDYNDESD